MTKRDRDRGPGFEFDDLELPPLEDDEPQGMDDEAVREVFGDYEDSLGDEADEGPMTPFTTQSIVDDLEAAGELSFLDDEGPEAPEAVSLDTDVVEEEETWLDDRNDAGLDPALVAPDGFDDDELMHRADDNDGPLEERIEIDRSGWDDLPVSEEQDAFSGESPQEAMARLGIELGSSEAGVDASDEDAPALGKAQYLGPTEGRVTALGFVSGTVFGLGDGLYQMAADGMLHSAHGALEFEKKRATSAASFGGRCYAGTRTGGVLVLGADGRMVGTHNGWISHGFEGTEPSHGTIPTSVTLFGCVVDGAQELLLLTGKGQLFVSRDEGSRWDGPLLKEKCLGVATGGRYGPVAVLVDDPVADGVSLFVSDDLRRFDGVTLPAALEKALTRRTAMRGVHLACAGELLALAVPEREMPVFTTSDRGRTWSWEASPAGATAVTVSGMMVAATRDQAGDGSVLKMSHDGGRSWHPLAGPLVVGDGTSTGEVFALVVDDAHSGHLWALTPGGVFHVTLPEDGEAH